MTMFGSQWLANPSTGYTINNSCVFDAASSAYMNRTPGSAGNRRTWTWSGWVKRGNLGSLYFFGAVNTGTDSIGFTSTNILSVGFNNATEGKIQTNRVFQDVAAWYHIVVAIDTTNGTAGNRMRLYINGTEETSFAADVNPSENYDTGVNNTAQQTVGSLAAPSGYFDGYLADVYLIDGSQLAASDFGETNDEGVWVPKAYSGSYGTNGIHLKFQDSSALGDDTSGNGNDYTANNLAAADQRTDTPTNNQVTFNPLNNQQSGADAITEGNTVYNGPSTRTMISLTANLPSTGKWAVAFSASVVSTDSGWNFGITKSNNSNFGDAAGSNEDVGASDGVNMSPASSDLQLYDYSTSTSIDPTLPITTSDEFWLAVDMATGKCFLGISNQSDSNAMIWVAADAGVDGNPADGSNPTATISAMVGSTDYTFAAAGSKGNSNLTLKKSADLNGTIPTGYTYFEDVSDFPAPTLKDPSTNFQAVTYSGTGSSNAITFGGNADMQPDAVLIKQIDGTRVWTLYDAPRGVNKYVQWNDSDSESDSAASLTAFGSDGFTVGTGAWVNVSGGSFLGYGWAAGNSGSSNTAGTINTTTTYVDATAGISISTYTGNGSDDATIGHGLGVTPATVFIMPRSNGDHHLASNWETGVSAFTEKLKLNENEAPSSSSTQVKGASSTTITFGTDVGINGDTRTYVAYAWAEVDGFSKFGTYTGNANADGPVVICGFKPAFAMIKRVDSTGDWPVKDKARSPDNEAHETLYANTTASNFGMGLDILSNGFKPKTSDATINASGGVYIFMAFAESPFGGDGVAPATAR